MRKTILPALLISLLFLASCGSTGTVYEYHSTKEDHLYYEIDNSLPDDPEMAAYLAPHIRDMAKKMDRVITVSDGIFEKSSPEGPLGNLTADIVRSRATAEMRETVHVGILNNGGLRVPLPQGEITVGHIYELMPFENYIAVLRFNGKQLLSIADELARVNGEPVSGIRFRIVDGQARDVLVDSDNVDPDAYYWVATNNWMADGGGASSTLWEPLERVNLDVLIRDAIIHNLEKKPVISPATDHRIRN